MGSSRRQHSRHSESSIEQILSLQPGGGAQFRAADETDPHGLGNSFDDAAAPNGRMNGSLQALRISRGPLHQITSTRLLAQTLTPFSFTVPIQRFSVKLLLGAKVKSGTHTSPNLKNALLIKTSNFKANILELNRFDWKLWKNKGSFCLLPPSCTTGCCTARGAR